MSQQTEIGGKDFDDYFDIYLQHRPGSTREDFRGNFSLNMEDQYFRVRVTTNGTEGMRKIFYDFNATGDIEYSFNRFPDADGLREAKKVKLVNAMGSYYVPEDWVDAFTDYAEGVVEYYGQYYSLSYDEMYELGLHNATQRYVAESYFTILGKLNDKVIDTVFGEFNISEFSEFSDFEFDDRIGAQCFKAYKQELPYRPRLCIRIDDNYDFHMVTAYDDLFGEL